MAWKKLPENPDETKMSLGEHLDELRVRIIRALLGLVVALGITLWYGDDILNTLEAPVVEVMQEYDIEGSIVSNTPQLPFLLWMRASLLAAFILASPWVFYQMWMFIAAGLYPHERKYVNWGVPFSALLFCAGAAFFLLFISKQIMRFFLGFGKNFMPHVTPMLNVKDYISLMTTLMVVFGLAFQMPIVVFILGKMGLVTVRQLNKYRRYVIVIILIVAALATSPSPVDQIGLAIPMWLLYELGIVLVYFFCKPKPAEAEESSLDEAVAPGTALATAGAQTASGDYDSGQTDYDEAYGEDYEDYYNDSYDDEDYGEEDYAGDDNEDQDYPGDESDWAESGFADDETAAADYADDQDASDDVFPEEGGYTWSPPAAAEDVEQPAEEDDVDEQAGEDEPAEPDDEATDPGPGPDEDQARDETDAEAASDGRDTDDAADGAEPGEPDRDGMDDGAASAETDGDGTDSGAAPDADTDQDDEP